MITSSKRPVSLETAREILDDLRGRLIIVEGVRDQDALECLDIRHVLRVNRKPIAQFAEEVAAACGRDGVPDEVVILTDFDRKGRRMAALLRTHFARLKIRVNSRLRGAVAALGITNIEEMAGLAGTLEGDSYGKACTNINKIPDKGQHKGRRSG